MSTITKIFRIKSKTGEFSTGGHLPRFSKKGGKCWVRLNDVLLHLSQVSDYGRDLYAQHEAIVVEYEVVETPVLETSCEIWLEKIDARKKQQEEARKAAWAEYKHNKELAS